MEKLPQLTGHWPPSKIQVEATFKPFIAPAYGAPTEIGTGFSALHLLLDTTYSNYLMFEALRLAVRTG